MLGDAEDVWGQRRGRLRRGPPRRTGTLQQLYFGRKVPCQSEEQDEALLDKIPGEVSGSGAEPARLGHHLLPQPPDPLKAALGLQLVQELAPVGPQHRRQGCFLAARSITPGCLCTSETHTKTASLDLSWRGT